MSMYVHTLPRNQTKKYSDTILYLVGLQSRSLLQGQQKFALLHSNGNAARGTDADGGRQAAAVSPPVVLLSSLQRMLYDFVVS